MDGKFGCQGGLKVVSIADNLNLLISWSGNYLYLGKGLIQRDLAVHETINFAALGSKFLNAGEVYL